MGLLLWRMMSAAHGTSSAVTNDVRVEVVSQYIPERSYPTRPLYFFSYDITITNDGTRTVQLINRYWRIRDAFGRIEEVRGPGVVGAQPLLDPGQSFSYTSFCPLTTEFGSMEGHYEMIYPSNRSEPGFEAKVACFQLISPQAAN